MTRGLAALASIAVAGCFTDYEVGDPAGIGSSSETSGPSSMTTSTSAADDGSGDGSGSGGSGGACDPAPAGMGSCPARCTGGCALGTCTIACLPRSGCDDTDITCPQGWPCVVLCDGENACSHATVHCSDGPCELQCPEPQSCDGASLRCGTQSCNAWCGEDGSELRVDCGPACACQSNCSSSSDGSEGSEGSGTDGGSSD